MRSTLEQLHQSKHFDVNLIVTSMHLSEQHGLTVQEVRQSGLPILAELPVDLSAGDHLSMGQAIGHELISLSEVLANHRPDILLLLGDRGEMLAAAIAGAHLNIHTVHIHGGERSGTVDEMVRHCISKLSHYHFTATDEAKQRLLKMGEHPDSVFVTGAPGLDDIAHRSPGERIPLFTKYGLKPEKSAAICLFHPVTQEATTVSAQISALMSALKNAEQQLLILTANADAGGKLINKQLRAHTHEQENWVLKTHLPREDYLSLLAQVDFIIGNSSSAIIEAASFGIRAVNIGTRQNLRQQSGNIINCDPNTPAIKEAIKQISQMGIYTGQNCYGDGQAGHRIHNLLQSIELNETRLKKCNAY